MSRWFEVAGDPEYGVPVLDPLVIKELTTKHAEFEVTTRNSTTLGVKDTMIEDIRYCVFPL
jgi:hypothetical protein